MPLGVDGHLYGRHLVSQAISGLYENGWIFEGLGSTAAIQCSRRLVDSGHVNFGPVQENKGKSLRSRDVLSLASMFV